VASLTIPQLYPDLARLLSAYFALERSRSGSHYRDAVLVFVLTESHATLLQTLSDARAILGSETDLRAFESYLVETGFEFGQLGNGVTARDWLSDVVMLIASSV
jgi:hypothetical protein